MLNVALYCRISKEDALLGESNSITNQRDFLRAHFAELPEFANARFAEYTDDGISGQTTERGAYQRLIEDAKLGNIDCVASKDLSRMGRSYIETGEFLEFMMALSVRIIAVGNDYDSELHPLSRLELSLINLFNQQYVKDIALKSITSRLVKVRRGENLAHAPFGYVRSAAEKNRLEIDPESAEYVRQIFALAAAGAGTTEIAATMNAQNVPTPSAYKHRSAFLSSWKHFEDCDKFWDGQTVRHILRNRKYTGCAIANTLSISGKQTLTRPQDEWIVVPDSHDAIVTVEQFELAQRAMIRERGTIPNLLGAKVKCAVCGRAMLRAGGSEKPHYYCQTSRFTSRFNCQSVKFPQFKLEEAVLASIKAHAAMLVDKTEMALAVRKQSDVTKRGLERTIESTRRTITSLEHKITLLFTDFVSERITRDEFSAKKLTLRSAIAKQEEQIALAENQLNALSSNPEALTDSLSKFEAFKSAETLNRELIDALLDRIYVHSETEIEIRWLGC